MLKNLKLSKRDSHGSKGRITSADISTPTNSQESANVIKHMKTIPLRHGSTHSTGRNSNSINRFSKDILSPEKVIKALYNYHSQTPNEVSFVEGEFFYVINETEEWYEASNPSNGKKGMVPKSYFEEFDRTRPASIGGTLNPKRTSQTSSMEQSKMGSLYAIVLYDFKAEKSDELTAYAGENLFICAHHNYEWFIAKPIGRLGGPGLVPVGFVSIVEIATGYATGNDVIDDIKSVNLPTVQEWKTNIAKYKASNINLGTAEPSSSYMEDIMEDAVPSSHANGGEDESEMIISASVDSFGLEDDKYWFALNCNLLNGKSRKLKRYYQDFYELQVQLLDSFPAEAGKLRDSSGNWTKRILPYIPGPVPFITETITKRRREDLNVYVSDLIRLPDYISGSTMVRALFKLRDNGYDEERSQQATINVAKDGDTAVFQGENNINNNEDHTLTREDLNIQEKLSS